jgi:cytochrome c peroxidase
MRTAAVLVRTAPIILLLAAGRTGQLFEMQDFETTLENGQPFRNAAGHVATFSTHGFVDLTSEYFQPQGSNGRSCSTCHLPQDAWSITPATIQQLFDQTAGTHPIFNLLDANNPGADLSTIAAREAAFSMLLSRAVFRRGGALREPREWNLDEVDDPHGVATLTRLVHWRRAMPTINFALGSAVVNWDGGNSVGSDQRAGLENQARRNIMGAQQGPTTPDEAVVDNIVDFETTLFAAQLSGLGIGRLDADGARGGPQALASMPRVAGRFDLFDAWAGHDNPRRAQIARGQAVFNGDNAAGRSCNACHNTANDGTNINGTLFDIGTASAAARTADLPLYTFRNKLTGETRQLTDAGRGNVSGAWSDLGKFKTPTLRALAARAPYFHNGIAATIEDVIRHYEFHLGFRFTDAERADLAAFLKAL